MKPTLSGSAVVLSNPSAIEVGSAVKAFTALFGVKPLVRVKGHFPQSAIQAPEKGPALDSLNLTNEFHTVTMVGRLFLTVDLGGGLGLERVMPDHGVNVEVRLTLTRTDLDTCGKCGGTWPKGAPAAAQNHYGNCRG